MIFSVGLMAIAEDLAGRIPNDEAYVAERNASWLAIGRAFLKLDDFGSAFEALNLLTDYYAQVELRIAAAQWSGHHPESDAARDLLRDTVDHIESWEELISRRDLADLVKPICLVLGTEAVHAMSWRLRDPFTAGNVLVTLTGLLTDLGIRHETLRSAEELAKRVRSGNRDYALRWVVSAYESGGFEEDARRVRALMSQDLDLMNDFEAKLLRDAERVLKPLVPPDPDTPRLRLRRFLEYGYNDLRVFFLTECSEAGGLDDQEAEQLVNDEVFHRIAPPRPPSIYSDPSHFDLDSLTRSLFGRPICQRASDRSLIDGNGSLTIADLGSFINTLRDLFQGFGEIAPRFSPEQVDQGVWYLFGEPFWLVSQLVSGQIPSEQVIAITHAMYYPFRDYYLPMAELYSGTAFFMWWDNFSSGCKDPVLNATAIDVLRRILVLPHKACRDAALHGLNHLFPDPRASAIIETYLDNNRESMSKDEIVWAKLCKAGEAQ